MKTASQICLNNSIGSHEIKDGHLRMCWSGAIGSNHGRRGEIIIAISKWLRLQSRTDKDEKSSQIPGTMVV